MFGSLRSGLLHAAGAGLLAIACGGPGQATPTPAGSPVTQPAASPAPPSSQARTTQPSPAAAPAGSPAAFPFGPQPFAVLLDNNPEGRPQHGLDAADVVYEAPTEGGIPRLMAVFLRDTPAERIGPVRSARHYFVYLVAEYRVPLVHIGASPQGFQALQETGLERVDESEGHGGFSRDPSRPAPHNAFVSTASVRDELQRRGARTTACCAAAGLAFGGFQPGREPATRLRLAYSQAGFSAQYDYDAGSRSYPRSQDAQPHVDGTSNRRYAPRSIIVQQVRVTPIPNDDAGRVDVDLVASGNGLLVAEGTRVPLQWSKASPTDPTRFTRQDGAPFSLPDGQVWIELVPLDAQIEVS